MARRKTAPRRTASSWLSQKLLLMLLTAVSGGGLGGHFFPNLPIVGPFVRWLTNSGNAAALAEGNYDKVIKSVRDEAIAGIGSTLNSSPAATSSTGPSAYPGYPSNTQSAGYPSSYQGAPYPSSQYGQAPTHAPTYPASSTSPAAPPGYNPGAASPYNPGAASPYSPSAASPYNPGAARPTGTSRPADRLRVASFNIQVFGESKLAKPEVTQILAAIVRQFDIVAIQEIRSKRDDVMPRFLNAVNADGSRYHYLIGPRLGRTVSTEQYAYVFDTSRVEYNSSQVGSMTDPADRLHREPFVARFRAITPSPQHSFSFWMLDVHTDPDEVPQEVDALADVFRAMQAAVPDEDDVIMLGDFNASPAQMGRINQIPGIAMSISGVPTNTRRTQCYDNIIFSRFTTTEFSGRAGVYDMQTIFGLSQPQALEVSDHMPVWAEFSVWEQSAGAAMAQTAVQPMR